MKVIYFKTLYLHSNYDYVLTLQHGDISEIPFVPHSGMTISRGTTNILVDRVVWHDGEYSTSGSPLLTVYDTPQVFSKELVLKLKKQGWVVNKGKKEFIDKWNE